MYFFLWHSHVIIQENICFVYLLESPRRGDSNKYTKRMIHKKLFKSISYSCFRRVHVNFFYNSKFDLTAKSLVTNSVVISRVLCMLKYLIVCYSFMSLSHILISQNIWFIPLLSPRTTKLWRGYRVCPVRMYVSTYVRTFVRSYVHPL